MPRLRVGVLYDYFWGEDEERSAGARPKRKPPAEDVQQVYEALREAGHTPVYLRLDGTTESLRELAETESDVVFNLVESFAGDDTHDRNVAGYLELLGRAFTGSGSEALYLAQDKPLAKKLFAFHDIPTPTFATMDRGRVEHAHDLHFPVIVKPAREDGSIGIGFTSVCGSLQELLERIDAIHGELDSSVIIEEYVEGRELYVGIVGNGRPRALPVVELDLSKLPKGVPRIAGSEVKWERETAAYRASWPFFPKDLDEETTRRLHETALRAYQTLGLRDYGRIDFRLAADGTIHVIEVNPNPYLLRTAELAMAAERAGTPYVELVSGIVDAAMARAARNG